MRARRWPRSRANFFGRPADKLQLVGITGTNGKTTTSFLIDSIVRAAGRRSGLFGTIAYRTPLEIRSGHHHHAGIARPATLSRGDRARRRHARRARSQFARAGARPPVGLPLRRRRLHQSHARSSRFSPAPLRIILPPSAGCSKAPAQARPPRASSTSTTLTASSSLGLAARTITYGLGSGAQVTREKISARLFAASTSPPKRPRARSKCTRALVGRINVYNLLAAIATGVALGLSARSHRGGHPPTRRRCPAASSASTWGSRSW